MLTGSAPGPWSGPVCGSWSDPVIARGPVLSSARGQCLHPCGLTRRLDSRLWTHQALCFSFLWTGESGPPQGCWEGSTQVKPSIPRQGAPGSRGASPVHGAGGMQGAAAKSCSWKWGSRGAQAPGSTPPPPVLKSFCARVCFLSKCIFARLFSQC